MTKMLNLNPRIARLPQLFNSIPEIMTVILFGSYGTPLQTANSDIDFAVYFRLVPFREK